jgi:predicted HTH transcriptional regulator
MARIATAGEGAIDQLIADRQSEELFLDFKRSSDNGAGARLSDADRGNLAKAISGFGNSEGGVIIWGVDCRPNQVVGDVAAAKQARKNKIAH